MANGGVDGELWLLGVNHPLLGGVSVGHAGFIVEIHERGLFGKRFLGSAETDTAGKFSVRYSPGVFDRQLILEIYDSVHRLIYDDELGRVTDPVLVVAPIPKLAINAHGWVVTMDDVGAAWLSTGNQVTFLMDNARAWGDLTSDVTAATETVHLLQLQFELDYMFTKFNPDPPVIGSPTNGDRLEVELEQAGDRGLEVQLLMNDFHIGFGADSWRKVRDFFEDTNVHVRGFKRVPIEGAMHAKVGIIDDKTAYSIGSGLLQEYFDGAPHLIDDPRRGEMAWPENQMRTPIHDLSAKVTGPAVRDFESIFQMLWSDLSALDMPPRVPAAEGHAVQLSVTIPADAVPEIPNGATGILVVWIRQMGPRWLIAETTRIKGLVVRVTPNVGNHPFGSSH